jgi:uncharacterized tellurite resistance protein B-like protein
MILIGTFQWASTRLKGVFACPNCESTEQFRLRASRPFLTLYFIPVLPIGGLSEYVECRRCKTSYEPLILSSRMLPSEAANPAGSSSNAAAPAFEDDLLSVLALMMVEDGQVTEEEIRVARRLYENIAEDNLSREDLGHACSVVRMQRLSTMSFLATCSKRRTHEEKLLIVQAMFGVASAEGQISPGRLRALLEARERMELDESEFQRAVDSTSQWLS